MSPIFVPVVDQEHKPLMPTTPARARRWIRSGKATSFWKGGFFCVRLGVEPSAREKQPIAVSIDPGSKGIKRGTLVKHPKWGKAYVGETMDGQLSLHDLQTGKRLTQSAKVADCRLIKVLRWRTRLVPLFPTK